MKPSRWSIAVLASRETPEMLCATVAALVVACRGTPSTIDVIVNGNRALADGMLTELPQPTGALVRLWFVALGDKSHAWNTYLESIAPAGDVVFFVDGYAQVAPDSLRAIEQGLANHPEAWAATGVPTKGRSARKLRTRMLATGGIHGNLYALRGSTAALLKARGFRYPLGMYRSDPLLGAVVCFNADPASNSWDDKRLLVVAGATWIHEPLRWYRWSALSTQWKRMQRQAQGTLENAAVRQHLAVDKRRPETLPRTVTELVANWIATRPLDAAKLLRHPLNRRAAEKLTLPRDWSLAEVSPELLRVFN
jgi:hypothetical protein